RSIGMLLAHDAHGAGDRVQMLYRIAAVLGPAIRSPPGEGELIALVPYLHALGLLDIQNAAHDSQSFRVCDGVGHRSPTRSTDSRLAGSYRKNHARPGRSAVALRVPRRLWPSRCSSSWA